MEWDGRIGMQGGSGDKIVREFSGGGRRSGGERID